MGGGLTTTDCKSNKRSFNDIVYLMLRFVRQFFAESHKNTEKTVTPPKYPSKLAQLNYVQAENTRIIATHNNTEGDQENRAVCLKKKKDKAKKKKQKGQLELSSPLPPPRANVPPLNPASLGPLGVTKLGALDLHGKRPVPWEHVSLGPWRHAPPEVSTTSPRMGRCPEGQALESAFERPRTPEPPQSPRDMTPHHVPQPYPPGSMRGNQDAPLRGSLEGVFHEREMNYGPPGPLFGPLARTNGQAPLRNMVSKSNRLLSLKPLRSITIILVTSTFKNICKEVCNGRDVWLSLNDH